MRALSALPAALLFLASLAACSGGPASTTAACDTPGVTADEVKAGFIYPYTGPLSATFIAARAGLAARIGVANAAGGVNGRKITYDWADDRGQPDTNLVVARNLVENKKDFAVIEVTPVSSGGAQYLSDQKVPVLGMAVEPVWSKYRNMFTYFHYLTAVSSSTSVTTFGKYVQEHGGTRVLFVTDAAGLKVSDVIANQIRTSLASTGMTVTIGVADQTPTDGQIREIARQLKANNLDVLASTLTTDAFARIVAGVRSQGLAPKVILSGGQKIGAQLLQKYGSLIAGLTTYSSAPVDPKDPAIAAYKQALARYAPELQDLDDPIAEIGYVAGDMLVRGLQAAGPCPTRESFINGLRAVKGYDAGGIIPTVNFEADFGKPDVCYPFVAVNAEGTGLTTIDPNYCGERIEN
ncbi:ABC transporter substrate-binding protein [Frankia sp. AiPa1]|uniref:ABC transporter substrate-binding protein n=1 Tax=Frankia sp. AiPa1 TaxID=573492 RepID=UPI00202B2958|nr:ABC transporter substrate-binding protein [Frankia sp. AiPa1]